MRQAPVEAKAVSRLIEDANQLATFEPRLPTGFAFVWDGRRFNAKVDDRQGRAIVSVIGDLGAVPYTAENPTARKRYAALLAATLKSDSAVFRIGRNRRLQIEAEDEVERPVTGASIVSALARALLRAKPYMIFADELGAKAAPKRLKFQTPRRQG